MYIVVVHPGNYIITDTNLDFSGIEINDMKYTKQYQDFIGMQSQSIPVIIQLPTQAWILPELKLIINYTDIEQGFNLCTGIINLRGSVENRP